MPCKRNDCIKQCGKYIQPSRRSRKDYTPANQKEKKKEKKI